MSVSPLRPAPSAPVDIGVRIARIVAVEAGCAVVSFDGQRLPARCALTVLPSDGQPWIGHAVMLAFEAGDRALPVIVGLVGDTLPTAAGATATSIDAQRVSIIGRDEVVLRCGEASVTLRADGQVIVKGQRITSRAAEAHKIRGATVQIN